MKCKMFRQLIFIVLILAIYKVSNEILFNMFSVSGEDIVLWKAYLPSLLAIIPAGLLGLYAQKYFDVNSKINTDIKKNFASNNRLAKTLKYCIFAIIGALVIFFLSLNKISFFGKNLALVCSGKSTIWSSGRISEPESEKKAYRFENGAYVFAKTQWPCEWESKSIRCKDPSQKMSFVTVDRLSGSIVAWSRYYTNDTKTDFFDVHFEGSCEEGSQKF